MKYAYRPCVHCQKIIEAGPMQDASWAWCVTCQGIIHRKYPCNERCPRTPRWTNNKQNDIIQKVIHR